MDESLLKVKIDWRGRLYLNRAGTLISVKCKYNNPNMIEKLCTHDCVLFCEPKHDLIFKRNEVHQIETSEECVRINLCVGSVYCKPEEFLDQRVCKNKENIDE